MKKRDSNIELLRIIAMIMIVANHFAVHSNFQTSPATFINCIWLQILSTFGKLGVNIFILISGYYLISSKEIKISKVLKLFLQMLLYSLIIYIIFVRILPEAANLKDLTEHILAYPIWWFAKNYLILYLLHPYINILLNKLNKKSYQKLIICSTIIFSIIPTMTAKTPTNDNIIWFIYMYSLGAYIKKYSPKLNWKPTRYILIALMIFTSFFIESVIIFDVININSSFNINHIPHLFNLEMFSMEKVPNLLTSLFLFIGFSKLKISYHKIINIISSTTFGIYLIHDEPYIRNHLWNNILKSTNYSNTAIFIPYSIMIIILVFLICSIIELLRIYLIEKRYMKAVDKQSEHLNKIINKIFNSKLLEKI